MSRAASRRLWIVVLLILCGAAIRISGIGRESLRGDEAFTVRYWAQPLSQTLDPVNGLAWREPHPFGTYTLYFGWKTLTGDSVVGMRSLSALLNLIGIAAIYRLGRTLFTPQVGTVAAFVWTVAPNMIWHAQDARNYATWAALSALSLWLFMVAVSGNTRRAWIIYLITETINLYVFFFEALFIPLHILYYFMFVSVSERLTRRLVPLISVYTVMLVLIIPWFGQLSALAGTGYAGTAVAASPVDLITRFPGALTVGEVGFDLSIGLSAVIGMVLIVCILVAPRTRQVGFLIVAVIIPLIGLYLISTRVNVFAPRYVLPLSVPLFLLFGLAAYRPITRRLLVYGAVAIGLCYAVWIVPNAHKAPDWAGLNAYLRANVQAEDMIIMQSADGSGSYDPAFGYYYRDGVEVIPLPYPGYDSAVVIGEQLAQHDSVWLIVSGEDQLSGLFSQQGRESGSVVLRGFRVSRYIRN